MADAQKRSIQEIAALLVELGQRLELSGDSPFKARAYYKAAESLQALTEPLPELIARGKLKTIPGVGEAIAEKIIKFYNTGTHPTLEQLREQIPGGVLQMMTIPGVGPKKAALIYQELKLSSLDELAAACKANKLADCKGLGASLQNKILKGLEFAQKGEGQILMHKAAARLEAACLLVRNTCKELNDVQITGPMRRSCEVVDKLTVIARKRGEVVEPAVKLDGVTLEIAEDAQFATALLFTTGSDAHLEQLVAYAKQKGFALSPQGLKQGKKAIACKDEAAVYAALGLAYIEPELREGRGEIEWAAQKKLPKLVTQSDLRGILHSHTDFSDGAQTLRQMADAVRARGYQYYGVCDHSQSAAYAGGLKADRIAAQQKLADEFNVEYNKHSFRIFKGIESDILEDGALDYPEAVLKSFDFIVASIHSRFTLPKEAQTRRLINAVSNPYTTILGHMTGRLLLRREGYQCDVDAVLQACAKHGVAVEINANPHRLDVDWRFHQRALELGCWLSINPDAHDIEEIDLVRWGVAMARKGGVPPERVLSCLDLDAITRHFAARRKA